MRTVALLMVAALMAALPGCALTSKAQPLAPRYFNPQPSVPGAAAPAAQPFELKLGQISAASNLDERVAYRIDSAEVGFYDDRRWTELPEAYLRRALERDLFEQRKLTRVVSGLAPVLDVELTAFEELRQNPPKVRVALTFSLRDERRSLLERSLVLEAPASGSAGSEPSATVAQALTDTLARAVTQAGDEVVAGLARAAAAAAASRDGAQP
jgi:cholesterol transport system auxiliary component